MVPEENVLIIYDRALFDDKAYITDEQFREILAYFGKTEQEVLAGYDAVLHLFRAPRARSLPIILAMRRAMSRWNRAGEGRSDAAGVEGSSESQGD